MKAESLAENCNHVGRQCQGRMGRWMTALPLTWELFQLTQKQEYLSCSQGFAQWLSRLHAQGVWDQYW